MRSATPGGLATAVFWALINIDGLCLEQLPFRAHLFLLGRLLING